jgi:hypothetical protein
LRSSSAFELSVVLPFKCCSAVQLFRLAPFELTHLSGPSAAPHLKGNTTLEGNTTLDECDWQQWATCPTTSTAKHKADARAKKPTTAWTMKATILVWCSTSNVVVLFKGAVAASIVVLPVKSAALIVEGVSSDEPDGFSPPSNTANLVDVCGCGWNNSHNVDFRLRLLGLVFSSELPPTCPYLISYVSHSFSRSSSFIYIIFLNPQKIRMYFSTSSNNGCCFFL